MESGKMGRLSPAGASTWPDAALSSGPMIFIISSHLIRLPVPLPIHSHKIAENETCYFAGVGCGPGPCEGGVWRGVHCSSFPPLAIWYKSEVDGTGRVSVPGIVDRGQTSQGLPCESADGACTWAGSRRRIKETGRAFKQVCHQSGLQQVKPMPEGLLLQSAVTA